MTDQVSSKHPVKKKKETSTEREVAVFTAAFTFRALPPMIPYFRGAVNEVVASLEQEFQASGIAPDLFHNHDENGKNMQRYPLIQYQFSSGKIRLTGVDEGARALQVLIMNFPEDFEMNGKKIKTGDIITRKRKECLAIDDKMHYYRMYKWMALNKENFEKYEKLNRFDLRVQMLDNVLQGNLERFAVELGLGRAAPVLKAWLVDSSAATWAQYLGYRVRVFNVTFASNMILPPNLGIGKGVSRGFGRQQPLPLRRSKFDN